MSRSQRLFFIEGGGVSGPEWRLSELREALRDLPLSKISTFVVLRGVLQLRGLSKQAASSLEVTLLTLLCTPRFLGPRLLRFLDWHADGDLKVD